MKSIAVKLLKTVFSLYIIVTVMSTCVHIYSDYNQRKGELLQELENIQTTFAPTLANSLWDFNKQQTVISAKGMENIKHVTGIVVKDEEGAVVYRSEHILPIDLESIKGLKQSYELYQKAEDGRDAYVGEIILVSDHKFIFERVRLSILIIVGNAFLKTVVLWWLFLFAFKKYLKEPLDDLSQQAEGIKFSPGDTSKIELKHSEYTELDILQTSINSLLQRLSEALNDLHGLNNNLEEKVRERTSELESKNKMLLKAKDETERANRVKGDFIANISHELRTPLNAIIGFTEVLRNEYGSEENIAQFEAILSSSSALLRIINDILDMTKVEQGKMSLHYEAVNILSIFEQAYARFKVQADQKDVQLKLNLPKVFEPCVRCDETRLCQILNNLLENAIKFTSEGEVSLRLEQEVHNNWADIRIIVSDTGVGIPREIQEKIFEPFEQNEAQSPKFGGTGLGLAISRKLADLMGGELRLESEEGEGSTFILELNNLEVAVTGQKDSINEYSDTFSHLSLNGHLQCSNEELDEIAREFLRFQPLMENFLESMTINDVQEIASSLKGLCARIPLPELIAWRQKFKTAYDNFDMNELENLFRSSRDFMKQIEEMKE